jgi:16S rRNA G966 N2-methylase RsmD
MTADDLVLLQQPRIQQFIREHTSDDPYQLVLQAGRNSDIPIQLVAEQIQARQKARTKLPEWYQTEGIIFPPLLSMEQCSSETTARFKGNVISGTTAIDLTGGAGVDACYLRRSFEQVHYVEQNPLLVAIAQHNFQQLGVSIQTHSTTAKSFLASMDEVDLIYLDPARRGTSNQKVFRLADCSPNVLQLLPDLLAKGKQVLLKTSPMLDIEAARRELKQVAEVQVLAVNNECKEVLYLLSAQAVDSPLIKAFDLNTDTKPLEFRPEEEAEVEVEFAEPQHYLYEPNAAVMKAGAFRTVAQKWKLAKLHPHTHLYTSQELIPDFPGRSFRVETVLPYQKKKVQQHVPEGKANVTTRNFSDSVATVRKKLGLKEGGNSYLFATRTQRMERAIIVTRKADK